MKKKRLKKTATSIKVQILKEILLHKVSSMVIGVVVVSAFGIPLVTNLSISAVIILATLTKDYYLRKYFSKQMLEIYKKGAK